MKLAGRVDFFGGPGKPVKVRCIKHFIPNRSILTFSRFLESAAFSNGEVVNFSDIAADCGVSAPTIKEYFHIPEETLIGRFLPSYRKKPKRWVIQSPKFFMCWV